VGKPECAVTPSLPEDFIRSLTTGNSSLHGDLKAGRSRAATATWLTIVTAVFKFVIRVADPIVISLRMPPLQRAGRAYVER
jgi:hypothetical protein